MIILNAVMFFVFTEKICIHIERLTHSLSFYSIISYKHLGTPGSKKASVSGKRPSDRNGGCQRTIISAFPRSIRRRRWPGYNLYGYLQPINIGVPGVMTSSMNPVNQSVSPCNQPRTTYYESSEKGCRTR